MYLSLSLRVPPSGSAVLRISRSDCDTTVYNDDFTVTFREQYGTITVPFTNISHIDGVAYTFTESEYDYDHFKFIISLFAMGNSAHFVIRHLNNELIRCHAEIDALREEMRSVSVERKR